MKNKNRNVLPKFANSTEEFEFWQNARLEDHFDISEVKRGPPFVNLKLTSRPVTIRLTDSLVGRYKLRASRLDVPYQALMKQALESFLVAK